MEDSSATASEVQQSLTKLRGELSELQDKLDTAEKTVSEQSTQLQQHTLSLQHRDQQIHTLTLQAEGAREEAAKVSH